MAHFDKGPDIREPWGVLHFLRSTQDVKVESYTLAGPTVLPVVIDGANQYHFRKGTAVAKITSGPEAGKVGPVADDATDGREDPANIVGLNQTELPWQAQHRDVDIGVVYEATVYQARCIEMVGGVATALSDATADQMVSKKSIDIRFV